MGQAVRLTNTHEVSGWLGSQRAGQMNKPVKYCPHCKEKMRFRLGTYECPACLYVLPDEDDKASPIVPRYRTSESRLENVLRGTPSTRDQGDQWPAGR